jgi:endonuclease-3
MGPPTKLRGHAEEVSRRLAEEYPGDAKTLCALDHDGPFQLLVATILSAQTTDERVNTVTPALFRTFPTPEALAAAPQEQVEGIIRSTGFFRSKARSLIGMAQGLVERFGSIVPEDMDELITLPGVGRKTANVVRSVGFGVPGLPVDTHVGRLSRRLGLTAETDPDKVEQELDALVPPEDWGVLSLRLILHGRAVCVARTPRCPECVLGDICPSAQLPAGVPARARAKGGTGVDAPSRARAARRAR